MLCVPGVSAGAALHCRQEEGSSSSQQHPCRLCALVWCSAKRPHGNKNPQKTQLPAAGTAACRSTGRASRAALPCHGAQPHRAPQPPHGLRPCKAHGSGAAIPAGWVCCYRSRRRSREDGLSDLISLRIPATCSTHAVAARAAPAQHGRVAGMLCASKGERSPRGSPGPTPTTVQWRLPQMGFLGDADAVVGVTELCLRLQSSAVTQPICNTPGTASSPGPEPRPSPGGRAEEQRRVLPPVRTAAAAHGYAVRAQLLLCSSASLFCTKSGRRRKQLGCDLHCVCYCLVATAPPEQSRHPRSYEPAFINRYFQRDTASRDNANAAVLRRLTRNGSALLHSPPSPGTALYVET